MHILVKGQIMAVTPQMTFLLTRWYSHEFQPDVLRSSFRPTSGAITERPGLPLPSSTFFVWVSMLIFCACVISSSLLRLHLSATMSHLDTPPALLSRAQRLPAGESLQEPMPYHGIAHACQFVCMGSGRRVYIHIGVRPALLQ